MKQKILDVTVLAVLATALWHAVHPNVGIAVALVAGAVALAGRKSAEVPVSAAAVPVEEREVRRKDWKEWDWASIDPTNPANVAGVGVLSDD